MPLPPSTARALRDRGVSFTEDVPLARETWWRVGGPADALARLPDLPALVAVQQVAAETGCPVFVLGNGSNVLVADAGVRGLVVTLESALADVVDDGGDPPVLEVGAGMKNVVLLARAKKHGWTGIECFAGIPGRVGGAVVMNAGSTLGEIADALIDVQVVLPGGRVETLSREALALSYRTSHLPPGAVVASARLRTTGGDVAESQRRIRALLTHRKDTQPLSLPSCGSTFRNPPGDHAGRLIEAAGLKGYRVGDAQISEKHANFVVNLGSATAADLRAVVEHAQRTVAERFGVELEREVVFVGDWGGEP